MNSRLLILLAEDNPGDVLLVRDALQQHSLDFELIVASDGDKLRAFLQRMGNEQATPDALLVDLNLPRVDVPEMFREIRNHPCCADVPLIVITSSDSPRDRALAEQFQVTHYFRKPSDYDAFMKLGQVVKSAVVNGAESR